MSLAVVFTKSPTGDVYIVGAEDVPNLLQHGYILGGYAATEEEAQILAESFCH
jgi:hypothetical protein